MPSASFYANFDQFDRQVEAAKQTLGNFEVSCRNVQGSIKRIETAYDGSKLIGEAVKTAAAIEKIAEKGGLTEAELRKLNARFDEAADKARRVGQEMPASFSRVADSVKAQLAPLEAASQKTSAWGGALTSVNGIATGFIAGFTLDRVIGGLANAAASTIAWGGALTDMAAKTGVSTTALQRWEYAAKQGGNTLDQVVKASGELSKKLAEGQGSTVAALERLGLNLDTLRRMSPEQQFDEVAAALARTSDQGTRASASMALLGDSGKELLPTLTSDMKALGDEAERLGVIVDEQTLQAMDELGDAWQKMKDAGRGLLAEVLSPMVPAMNNIAAAAANAAKALREDFWPAAWKFSAVGAGGPLGMGAMFMQQFGGPGGGSATAPGRAPVPVVTTSEFVGSQHGLAGQDVVAGVFMRDLVPAARESAAALRQVAQSAAVLRDVNILNGSRNGGVSIFQTLPNQVPLAQLTRDTVVLGGQNNPWGGVGFLAPAGGSSNFSHLAPRPGFNWGGFGAQAFNTVAPLVGNLLPRNQGTQIGGMLGGLGATLGVSLGSIGGALGSVLPGIGTIAGMALGGLIGKLFGPSRGAILGKEADQRMDQTRAALLQQYGSLDAIRAMGPMGSALADAWGSRNVQGEAWFNERVRAFEEENQLLGEQRDLQSQIAGIEAQRTALNDSLKTTWDQVVEISGRYGISLEGLGAQVRQLGATTTWTSMLNDIEALTRAGGDMGGILLGMQDEINALVRESLRLGTEIPENMRPYVQALMDAGRLTDANKNSIRDINALRWGPAVQTQADIARTAMEKLDTAMQTLVDRLNEIIDRLANGLPAAAEQGARGAGGALSGIEPPEFRGGSVEQFSGGSGGVQDFGAGTLAMLHGREIVQTEAQYRASQAGVITASQVVLDKRVIGEIIFDLLPAVSARRGLVPGMAY